MLTAVVRIQMVPGLVPVHPNPSTSPRPPHAQIPGGMRPLQPHVSLVVVIVRVRKPKALLVNVGYLKSPIFVSVARLEEVIPTTLPVQDLQVLQVYLVVGQGLEEVIHGHVGAALVVLVPSGCVGFLQLVEGGGGLLEAQLDGQPQLVVGALVAVVGDARAGVGGDCVGRLGLLHAVFDHLKSGHLEGYD